MKKMVSIVAAGLFLISACGAEDTSTEETTSEATEPQTVTVTDTNGEVEVPLEPTRVVVYDFGILDSIDAIGEGENVVGIVKGNLPDYLSDYDNEDTSEIGTLQEPDFEAVNALEPDLIIISGRQRESLEELQEIAPTLLLTLDNTNIWESFETNMNTLGTIFSKEDEVAQQLESLTASAEEVAEAAEASGQTSLTVLLNEGQLSAYGTGSRFGIINDVFGFESVDDSIEASTHGQSVTYEYVLEQNPDILFVVDRTAAIGGDTTNNNLLENTLIQETNAYQNDSIIFLSPDIWYLAGGGLESTEQMIEEVSQAAAE